MGRQPLFVTLALTAGLCAAVKQAHNVPQPYEESLAKIADKYERPQNEMWNFRKGKLFINEIERKSLRSKRALSIRSGRIKYYFHIFIYLKLQYIPHIILLNFNITYITHLRLNGGMWNGNNGQMLWDLTA